jgi:hypothetical protein
MEARDFLAVPSSLQAEIIDVVRRILLGSEIHLQLLLRLKQAFQIQSLFGSTTLERGLECWT